MLSEKICAELVYKHEDILNPNKKGLKENVLRYFYKAASDHRLIELDRKESCRRYVGRSLHAFAASYWEEPVFFIIQLEPQLQAASKIVLSACTGKDNLNDVERNKLVKEEYSRFFQEAAKNLEIWRVCADNFETWDAQFNSVQMFLPDI